MMANRMEMLHAQLGGLLDNAQALLADAVPTSMMTHQTKNGLATGTTPAVYSCLAMQAEIRTLEFWRSIIAECVATFFYVVIVCSVTTSSTEHTVQINTALASGLAAAMLTSAFARVSGAHLNPAVTVAMMLTRQLSPLRSILYICAQCGGGIAGAALVLGVYARVNDPALQTGGGAFGMEFVLTFLVVYAYCASRAELKSPFMNTIGYATTNTYGTIGTTTACLPGVKPDPVSIGMAYAGCMVAWKGSLNPARALGSAFVSKNAGRFDQHWVFWVGPFLGAITGAFAYEYIFNPRRKAPFNFGSNYNATAGAVTTATTINGVGVGMNMGMGMVQPTHNTIIGTGGMPQGMRHHPDEQMSIRSCEDEIDMLDDLERAKQQHYKSNIMQDFNERNSTYSSSALMRSQQAGYGKNNYRQNYGDTMYGDKSMYGQPMNTNGGVGNYDAKSMYDGYGSKSCYNGYDGVNPSRGGGVGGMVGSSLRRSRSIHESAVVGGTPSQQRGLAAAARRRNPYDYLPDEPHMTSMASTAAVPSAVVPGATNKPDIMQSVDGRLDSSADTSRAMMNRSLNATAGTVVGQGSKLPVTSGRYPNPKDIENYNNDRMERNSDSAYHTRLGNGPIDDIYDYNKQQPRRKQLPILPDRPHPYSDQDDYATRAGVGNRVRMGSTARTDYYPEGGVVDNRTPGQAGQQAANAAAQYSATYSQQNGCSIAPNAGISY